MEDKCGRLTLDIYIGMPNNECGNSPSKTCANCHISTCWQHVKQRCTKGQVSRYGITQHLTAEHQDELRTINTFYLHDVKCARNPDPNGPERTVSITLRYQGNGDRPNRLTVHPGGIQSTPEGDGWTPDNDLAKWLATVEKNSPTEWKAPEDCAKAITQLVRNRN